MKTYRIYWAGELFDHKDLIGNALLAQAVEEISGHRYLPVLPQESEADSARCGIRDGDYDLLLFCDLYLGNFDGTDPDSGTVAEFMLAKMLDYPALLMRTDFRRCSEDPAKDNPWNLMCSGFPRCRSLVLHAMALMGKYRSSNTNWIGDYLKEIARRIVTELDAVRAEKALFTQTELLPHYRNAIRALGGQVAQLWPEEKLKSMLISKVEKGIY